MNRALAAAILLAGVPAWAHRLDEYLLGTILSVEKDRVTAETTLTPGAAVFPKLLAEMDTDGDGAISAEERRVYVARVLRDLTVKVDGVAVTPELREARFPGVDAMREGRGEIVIRFYARLPSGTGRRRITLENRHERGMAAYQVNCLVSRDPEIRIGAQKRNYNQSFYELEFEQPGGKMPAGMAAVFVAGWVGLAWRVVRKRRGGGR